MDRFQKLVLFAPGKRLEGAAIGLRSHSFDGLETKPIGIAVGRHFREPVSGSPAFMQALVDAGDERDAAGRHAVILRQQMRDDGFHQARFFRSEKTNGRNFVRRGRESFAGWLHPKIFADRAC